TLAPRSRHPPCCGWHCPSPSAWSARCAAKCADKAGLSTLRRPGPVIGESARAPALGRGEWDAQGRKIPVFAEPSKLLRPPHAPASPGPDNPAAGRHSKVPNPPARYRSSTHHPPQAANPERRTHRPRNIGQRAAGGRGGRASPSAESAGATVTKLMVTFREHPGGLTVSQIAGAGLSLQSGIVSREPFALSTRDRRWRRRVRPPSFPPRSR